MKDTRRIRGEGKVGCVIWLAIVALVAYGLFKIVPVKIANSSFEDFLTEQASFGSIKAKHGSASLVGIIPGAVAADRLSDLFVNDEHEIGRWERSGSGALAFVPETFV